jgi:hypothetical protein
MNASLVLVAAQAVLVFGLGSVSAAQDRVPVRITVYEEIQPGRTTYHYSVTNNSDRPITVVTIGVDAISGDFVLTAAPLGWTRDRGLPHASVGAPTGWTATVIPAEESNNVAIEWRASSHRTIAPHQTVRGLRVVLPRSTELYKSADWTTTDDLAGVATGKLEQVQPPGQKHVFRPSRGKGASVDRRLGAFRSGDGHSAPNTRAVWPTAPLRTRSDPLLEPAAV